MTLPPQSSGRGHKLQIAGAVTAGVGGVMILIGIVEGLRARSASRQVEDAVTQGIPFDPGVEKRGNSAETWEAILLTTGILAGAGGAALWYYGGRVQAAESTVGYRISLVPSVSTNGGGAWLLGRF